MAQVTYSIEDGECFANFDNRKKTVWLERWIPEDAEVEESEE